MMRPVVLVTLVLCMVSFAGAVRGQSTPDSVAAPVQVEPTPPRTPEQQALPKVDPRQAPRVQFGLPQVQAQRQLLQVDQLLRLGYISRANALLVDAEAMGAPESEVLPRRIQVAHALGDHAEAAALCRRALRTAPDDAQIWRQLSLATAAIGDVDSARIAADQFVDLAPDRKAGFAIAVEQFQQHERYAAALALLDSARTVLGDVKFQRRPRALSLLRLDRPEEAALEITADLLATPFNLALARTELLGDDAPPLPIEFTATLGEGAGSPRGVAVAALAANCWLRAHEPHEAVAVVEPFLGAGGDPVGILRNASALSRELPLLADPDERDATVTYLLDVLPRLARDGGLPEQLKQRTLNQLAQTCAVGLEAGLLDRDPERALDRYQELLALVAAGHPESEHLYAAEIHLSRYLRDRMRRPLEAAERLERLLLDLDLPLEGVALARLNLGGCYLAAGDTARGRLVLTRLGRDVEFREAAGHAHYELARLDLAEGHFGTARDRFAAVALDNPAAPYANDALALGLAVAEEMMNPTGGPDMLAFYARVVYFDLTAQPDSQRTALEDYLDHAVVQVDMNESQPLVERARFELALLYDAAGRRQDALEQLQRIVLDHPDGRYPAVAMAERGRLLATAGRTDEARQQYELLLVQYPDYLFAADIRDRVRNLP